MWLMLNEVNKGQVGINMDWVTHTEVTDAGTLLHLAPPHVPGFSAVTVSETPVAIVSQLHTLVSQGNR